MQALIKKNKLIRETYKKLELNYYINSALNKNKLLSPSLITNLNTVLTTSPKITKVRNICIVTGRTRAVSNKYKLSRIKFKHYAEAGQIPGIKKL
jgi:ribosomal protein S14